MSPIAPFSALTRRIHSGIVVLLSLAEEQVLGRAARARSRKTRARPIRVAPVWPRRRNPRLDATDRARVVVQAPLGPERPVAQHAKAEGRQRRPVKLDSLRRHRGARPGPSEGV